MLKTKRAEKKKMQTIKTKKCRQNKIIKKGLKKSSMVLIGF